MSRRQLSEKFAKCFPQRCLIQIARAGNGEASGCQGVRPTRPASFAGVASLPDLYSSLPITSASRISAAWLTPVRTVIASTAAVSQDNPERHDSFEG